MSDELTERLRTFAAYASCDPQLLRDAADEIERLRSQLDRTMRSLCALAGVDPEPTADGWPQLAEAIHTLRASVSEHEGKSASLRVANVHLAAGISAAEEERDELRAENARLRGVVANVNSRCDHLGMRLGEVIRERDRLRRALDYISTADLGGEIFPSGPTNTEYAADGNTVVRHVPPWNFLRGKGGTFLEAVEDAMCRDGITAPSPAPCTGSTRSATPDATGSPD